MEWLKTIYLILSRNYLNTQFWQKKGPERKGQDDSHYILPKIMLDFCQKLITLTLWLENVAWFPASAYLQAGSGLHLFRLPKIPFEGRCGARPVRM
jgi:hypothetical protein